jgi:putative transposase
MASDNIGVFKLTHVRDVIHRCMAKERKRHVQQELFRHGGARPGAGRPKRGERASERHMKRPPLSKHDVVHVVIRAVREVGFLRRRHMYKAVRRALVATSARESCRIVHLNIEGSHIHLLVEASHRIALARGMQAFQISAAKHINAALSARLDSRRRGQVFRDRYHAKIIRTPRQTRHALAYVLNNWRHHREDRAAFARTWRVDPFSSAMSFDGWRDLDVAAISWPSTYEPLPVREPQTWLLRVGWRRHGLIDPRETPGRRVTKRDERVFAE